jgi:hypothetical protein
MTRPPQLRAYIDTDTLYVITEAVSFLADLRHRHPNPTTKRLADHDLLHLLASLTLHAQTWMHDLIEDIHHDDNHPLTDDDIHYILAGATPDPVVWRDTT